jgi:hypothetical protein
MTDQSKIHNIKVADQIAEPAPGAELVVGEVLDVAVFTLSIPVKASAIRSALQNTDDDDVDVTVTVTYNRNELLAVLALVDA